MKPGRAPDRSDNSTGTSSLLQKEQNFSTNNGSEPLSINYQTALGCLTETLAGVWENFGAV